jgi:hypothetical protein
MSSIAVLSYLVLVSASAAPWRFHASRREVNVDRVVGDERPRAGIDDDAPHRRAA